MKLDSAEASTNPLVDDVEEVKDYDEAIRHNPNDANAFYNHGIARAAIGDVTGALQDYDAAISLNPMEAGNIL